MKLCFIPSRFTRFYATRIKFANAQLTALTLMIFQFNLKNY